MKTANVADTFLGPSVDWLAVPDPLYCKRRRVFAERMRVYAGLIAWPAGI